VAATFVDVVCDGFYGSGSAITHGTAWFTPSVTLTDVPDGMFVPQGQVPAEFRSRRSPTVSLLATDDANVQPPGWAWGVQFAYIPGNPASYNFFLPAGPASFTAAAGTPCVLGWGTTTALTTLPDGTGVQFSSAFGPFATATTYYVTGASGTALSLATIRGGTALASASGGSGSVTAVQYNLSALTPVGTAVTTTTYVTSFNGRGGAVVPQSGDYSVGEVTGAAPLASPAFTGTPTAPLATAGDDSARLATTAFLRANARRGIAAYADLPVGWDATWQAAKASALAGSGYASIAIIGDSMTAGVMLTQYDSLIYGWPGRLEALLVEEGLALGYEYFSMGAYVSHSGGTNPPSSPFSMSGTAAYCAGGLSTLLNLQTLSAWDMTYTAGTSPILGTGTPSAVHLLTVDKEPASSWQYQVDGGGPVTVNTSAPGGSGFTNSVLRRTVISGLTGSSHTVKLGNPTDASTLYVHGAGTVYGTSGLALSILGAEIGWKTSDFGVSFGATGAGDGSSPSLMPDHIQPLSGVTTANNLVGANLPLAPSLMIVMLGANDCTQGGHTDRFEQVLARFAVCAEIAGASLMFVIEPIPTAYGDNPGIDPGFMYQKYKRILRTTAQNYGPAAVIDIDARWRDQGVTSGYTVSGNEHPTGKVNPVNAAAPDGYLDIANCIYSAL
jgi:lysophospholipase L1-like esterase